MQFPLQRIILLLSLIFCPASHAEAPKMPWPPAYILQRGAEADCKVEEIIVKEENEAQAEAARIAAEKQREINEQKGIADHALEKRKEGDFRIETGIKRTGFALDLPEIRATYEDSRIPTVHIKVAETDVLVLVPGQCAIGKWDVPEFRGFSVKMRTHTIYVPCPVQKRVRLSVPQFTAGETTMRLPQVTVKMVRKDVSFHVPQFTYRDWEKVEKNAERKMEIEKELLDQALRELKEKKAGVTAEAIRRVLKKLKEETEQELHKSERDSLADVDAAYNELVRLSNEARETLIRAGADPSAAQPFEDVGRNFDTYRAQIRQPYEHAQSQLNELFDGLVRRYLGAVIEEVGAEPFCGKPITTPSISLEP